MLRAEDKVIDEFAVSAHLLSPLRGLDCIAYMMPWAHAHGYMLMPFHGTYGLDISRWMLGTIAVP